MKNDTMNLLLITVKFQRPLFLIICSLPKPLMFLQLIPSNIDELIFIRNHGKRLRYIISMHPHCNYNDFSIVKKSLFSI